MLKTFHMLNPIDLLKETTYIEKTLKKAIRFLNKKKQKPRANQFEDVVDGDTDFNIIEKTPDNNVTYIKYVPPLPDYPPQLILSRDRRSQKLKQIREQKERYRKKAKKNAIVFKRNIDQKQEKITKKIKNNKNSRTRRK